MSAKVTCSRCDSPEAASPLPKRFACRSCGNRAFCYACDTTHNTWCPSATGGAGVSAPGQEG